MRRFLLVSAALACLPLAAQAKDARWFVPSAATKISFNVPALDLHWDQPRPAQFSMMVQGAASSYTGPIDAAGAAATHYWALRCASTAIATGSFNVVNYRRSSDNAAQDGVCLTNGKFDIATFNTFAGSDAGAGAALSCTIAGTTATCTGATTSPNQYSTITGAGITQPCRVESSPSFTGGAGTMTVDIPVAGTSCGTVSVAEILTLQGAAYAAKLYDQGSGTAATATATAAHQPQILPVGPNGPPTLLGTGSTHLAGATSGNTAQPTSTTQVAERTAAFTSENDIFSLDSNNGGVTFFNTTTGTAAISAQGASASSNSGASNSVLHTFQTLFSGSSSILNVDGSSAAETVGTAATGTAFELMGVNPLYGYFEEAGLWQSTALSTGAQSAVCGNQRAFYTTPGSC